MMKPSQVCFEDQALGRKASEAVRPSLRSVKYRVFCKLIPLTIIEAQPENYKSTANLFQLPPYYQYGIGSAGFGAWRELAAHVLASDWVASGKQEQFPLMHHWRIVQSPGVASVESEADGYLTHAAAVGNDESAIRERLIALRASTSHIAIFSEHFPKTLSDWLVEEVQGATRRQALQSRSRKKRRVKSLTSCAVQTSYTLTPT